MKHGLEFHCASSFLVSQSQSSQLHQTLLEAGLLNMERKDEEEEEEEEEEGAAGRKESGKLEDGLMKARASASSCNDKRSRAVLGEEGAGARCPCWSAATSPFPSSLEFGCGAGGSMTLSGPFC